MDKGMSPPGKAAPGPDATRPMVHRIAAIQHLLGAVAGRRSVGQETVVVAVRGFEHATPFSRTDRPAEIDSRSGQGGS